MTHKERIEKALAFKETDRTPFSLWGHFPNKDRSPRRLAELSIKAQKELDLDFIKFMPCGLYTTIDYGIDLKVFSGYNTPPVANEHIIKTVDDWDNIHMISGTAGDYAMVLEAQRLCLEMMDERIPFLQTVFSPMTTAAKMAGVDTLIKHIHEKPEKVKRALEIITETTKQFVTAVVAGGADGIFFATQMSTYGRLEEKLHTDFVKGYDLEILNLVKDKTWFNIIHLHGANCMIKEVQDYPVQAISWHDRDDGPSMAEVRTFCKKAFIGGLSWGKNWLSKTREEVVREVAEVSSWRKNDKGIIMGPGCVIDPSTPKERLELVKQCVFDSAKQK